MPTRSPERLTCAVSTPNLRNSMIAFSPMSLSGNADTKPESQTVIAKGDSHIGLAATESCFELRGLEKPFVAGRFQPQHDFAK